MATENERTEFQRSAGALKPVAFPEFPSIPDVIKSKFPDLLMAWKEYDRKSDDFRIKLQNILRFGGQSIQLQPITAPPVVTTPIVPPVGVPGPAGPKGDTGEAGQTIIVNQIDPDDEALVLATVAL